MKKSNQKSNQKSNKKTYTQPDPFSIYGARVSSSGKYVNVTLVQGEDEKKSYRNALVKIKGKYIDVKVEEDCVVLWIPRLDIEDEEEEDEEDKDDPLKGKQPVTDEDLPF